VTSELHGVIASATTSRRVSIARAARRVDRHTDAVKRELAVELRERTVLGGRSRKCPTEVAELEREQRIVGLGSAQREEHLGACLV
jgi:hypothetical protein